MEDGGRRRGSGGGINRRFAFALELVDGIPWGGSPL